MMASSTNDRAASQLSESEIEVAVTRFLRLIRPRLLVPFFNEVAQKCTAVDYWRRTFTGSFFRRRWRALRITNLRS